jgi:hypothetical protein
VLRLVWLYHLVWLWLGKPDASAVGRSEIPISRFSAEGNGQTKCLNQTLEQYLRIFCNYQQDNWLEILPLAEFTCNNSPSATTGVTPFFANKGYHPNIMVIPECELASIKAHEFVINLEELHAELHNQMAAA